jgi:hypothetical protein
LALVLGNVPSRVALEQAFPFINLDGADIYENKNWLWAVLAYVTH